jgi:hypothetical protein
MGRDVVLGVRVYHRLDMNPATVVIDKGADGITPEAKWHWEFTSRIDWDLDTSFGGSSNTGGRATMVATMPGVSV